MSCEIINAVRTAPCAGGRRTAELPAPPRVPQISEAPASRPSSPPDRGSLGGPRDGRRVRAQGPEPGVGCCPPPSTPYRPPPLALFSHPLPCSGAQISQLPDTPGEPRGSNPGKDRELEGAQHLLPSAALGSQLGLPCRPLRRKNRPREELGKSPSGGNTSAKALRLVELSVSVNQQEGQCVGGGGRGTITWA